MVLAAPVSVVQLLPLSLLDNTGRASTRTCRPNSEPKLCDWYYCIIVLATTLSGVQPLVTPLLKCIDVEKDGFAKVKSA